MIDNVEKVARTLSHGCYNINTGNISPSSFRLRPKDQGYLSVTEIKDGWVEYISSELELPIGYAELDVSELESFDNDGLHFIVKEEPNNTPNYHAGIYTYKDGKQVYPSDEGFVPPPQGMKPDKPLEMKIKKYLIELSTLKEIKI